MKISKLWHLKQFRCITFHLSLFLGAGRYPLLSHRTFLWGLLDTLSKAWAYSLVVDLRFSNSLTSHIRASSSESRESSLGHSLIIWLYWFLKLSCSLLSLKFNNESFWKLWLCSFKILWLKELLFSNRFTSFLLSSGASCAYVLFVPILRICG